MKQTMLLLLLFYSASCTDDPSSKVDESSAENDLERREQITVDTLENTAEEKKMPQLTVRYRLDSLRDAKTADSILSLYSEDQQKTIYALNRIEAVRVGAGSNLVIPDTLLSDFTMYSPFPPVLPLLDSIPKTVLISQRIQAFALYEEGRLLRWGPVSSGKNSTPTPNGLHYGNYKAKRKVSTVNEDWILPYYFNFMNFEGVGVHQYLLPGFPASHACVRLYMEDAKYIYDWAEQWKLDDSGNTVIKNGTPFMVYGDYDYEDPHPWLKLVENPETNNLSDAEMKVLEEYVASYFRDERNFVSEEELVDNEA